jgi:cytochrome c oxidase cbb3-type subunit 2
MFESKAGVLFIAGLGFFAFAFLSNALLPVLIFKDLPEQPVLSYEKSADGSESAQGLVVDNKRLQYQFEELSRRYPIAFKKYYGEPNHDNLAAALRLGRQIYIGEGCWHCHSQFVRPVSNESKRWGAVAETKEYQNELQRPVMFGTRRVGPDLSREGGRRGNDWHAVHFYRPKIVSPDSPMPEYPWFFDGDPNQPNQRGIAIITYIQWLGSWLDSYPYYEELSELGNDEF